MKIGNRLVHVDRGARCEARSKRATAVRLRGRREMGRSVALSLATERCHTPKIKRLQPTNCIQRNHRIPLSTNRSKQLLNCTPDAIPCCPWMCCNKHTTYPRRQVGTYDMMMMRLPRPGSTAPPTSIATMRFTSSGRFFSTRKENVLGRTKTTEKEKRRTNTFFRGMLCDYV